MPFVKSFLAYGLAVVIFAVGMLTGAARERHAICIQAVDAQKAAALSQVKFHEANVKFIEWSMKRTFPGPESYTPAESEAK